MGKGFIYVFLVFIAVLLIFAIYVTVDHYIHELIAKRDEARLMRLRNETEWEPYLEVGGAGQLSVGVRRMAMVDEKPQLFEGPINMYTLEADHDPVDVQLKLGEARDRASLYNALREEKRHERPVD